MEPGLSYRAQAQPSGPATVVHGPFVALRVVPEPRRAAREVGIEDVVGVEVERGAVEGVRERAREEPTGARLVLVRAELGGGCR